MAYNLHQLVSQPFRDSKIIVLVLSDFLTTVDTATHRPVGRSDHATVIAMAGTADLRESLELSIGRGWRRTSASWTGLLILISMLKPPVHMSLMPSTVPCTALSYASHLCNALPIDIGGVPNERRQYKLRRGHGTSGKATLVMACTGSFLLPLSNKLWGFSNTPNL